MVHMEDDSTISPVSRSVQLSQELALAGLFDSEFQIKARLLHGCDDATQT